MDNLVYVKSYDAPPVNKKEILRYMGVKELSEEQNDVFLKCLLKIKNNLSYRVCYAILDILVDENFVDFGVFKACSKDLSKNLKNCKKAVVFAATIGVGIDRLILKYSDLSPFKALAFQAIGAERIESLCDVFSDEIKKGNNIAPRFSAGYGDLSLEVQKEIFKVLLPQKRIGLTLNESLIMSPSKSVTAIIGISDVPCNEKKGCANCKKTDCEFRREI